MAKNPLIRSFPKKVSKPLPHKSAGILDDYAVRKVIATKEGSITRTPTDDIDIANKKYVDDNFLKLDTSNDPLTRDLTILETTPSLILQDSDISGANYGIGVLKQSSNKFTLTLKKIDGSASKIPFQANEDKVTFGVEVDLLTNNLITSGRIGIGTDNPLVDLHTRGAGDIVNRVESTTGRAFFDIYAGGTGDAHLRFRTAGAVRWSIGSDEGLGSHFVIGTGSLLSINPLFLIDRTTGNVGIGTTSPAVSAKLDISTTTGALLVPRMTTTQRNALTAVDGMIIYNTTGNAFNFYENGSWVAK